MELRRIKNLGFTVLLAGVLIAATGLWLLLSPARYQASTTIKIDSNNYDAVTFGKEHPGASIYDAYFVQTELEVMQSQAVLSNVVESLKLNAVRDKQSGDDRPLKSSVEIRRLRAEMHLEPVHNTRLVRISFTSNDPAEAARIANAIAKAYQDFRQEQRRQQTLNGIQVLTNQYQQEEEQIRAAQTNLDFLRDKYNIKKSDEYDFEHSTTTLSRLPLPPEEQEKQRKEYERTKPFWEEKRKFANMVEFHKLLAVKIEYEKLNEAHEPTSAVAFVDVAMPPKYPIGPNRWLGGALLAMGIFPTIGGWLMIKASRQRRLSA